MSEKSARKRRPKAVEAVTAGPAPTTDDPYWLPEQDAMDLWAAPGDVLMSQVLHTLADSPLSVPDVCALRTTELTITSPNPDGTFTIAALPAVDGAPRWVTVNSEVLEELNHAMDEVLGADSMGQCGLPLFRVPLTLGGKAEDVYDHVPLSIPLLTYIAALMGLRTGIDVRPLLARGIVGDAS